MTAAGAVGEPRWQPSADHQARILRARVNGAIRAFFLHRGVLEVETPCLSPAANPDPAIEPLTVGAADFLRTSPEFPLKRLLCAGSGAIYELGRVFRGGESGRHHHCEFTMAEWYQPNYALPQLMAEVADLINHALTTCEVPPLATVYLRHGDLLEQLLGGAVPEDLSVLRDCCSAIASIDAQSISQMSRDQCLDLLFSVAGAQLPADQITFVSHFPASQAALARLDPDSPELALRFEAFAGGMELANGYDELRDADELHRRFSADNLRRQQSGLPQRPMDAALLAAQQHGLPACSGVSVGVDRLVMLIGDYSHIHEVLNFAETPQ